MAHLTAREKLLLPCIAISALLLLLLLSEEVVVVLAVPSFKKISATSTQHSMHVTRHLQAAHRHCDGTLYHSLCVSTLASIPNLTSKTLPQLISSVVRRTVGEVHSSASNCSGILHKSQRKLGPRQKLALNDCLELFDYTIDYLRAARSDLITLDNASTHYHHLQTLLSAAITNQYTCLDGFAYVKKSSSVRHSIEGRLLHISRLVSNSLAMLKKVPKRNRTGEVFEEYGRVDGGGFPTWLSGKDRRLLQAGTNANLVVAKDGTGNFTTIGEAVAAAPANSKSRFVIYIKAGAYLENVEVVKNKTNLMFLGDGIGKTVVKASLNVVDGSTTFRSATVAVVGNGFLARGITFENSAGPSKHQAVALRSGADLSAFYQCSFVGYQDTLYVHSLRQFYRECDVYGTVDFIFGNAAVVLQNCNLYARRPDPKQKNIFTAQGREDPNQNTGISIQNCKVAAASDLIPVQSSFKTYLGRPWKLYSRTVYLQSNLGDLIDPAGWLEWDGTFALTTLYYGEYMNRGPGSNTTNRVKWPGYRVINSSTEASQFTVGPFIQGDQWLGSTNIPFTSGLN